MFGAYVIETDVLVIGAGPAGSSAAIEAARAGADVCVGEATGELGGNGAYSTGYVALADSAFQRDAGIEDDAETFVADMVREADDLRSYFPEVELDVGVATRYARESSAAYDFLIDLGLRFTRIIPRPSLHSNPRILTLEEPHLLRDAFDAAYAAAVIRALLRHRGSELLTSDGRVTGATLTASNGSTVEVHAGRAVVVAAGWFAANPVMRRHYQPTQDPYSPYVGLDTNDGSGIQMMQAVGADTVNMTVIPQYLEGPSRFVEDCIAINGEGKRFYDEAGPYLERAAALRREPGEIGYYLYDRTIAERNPQYIAEMSGKAKSFDTLPEVERAIGCDPGAVVATVERWNALVASGADRDPDFNRVVFPWDRALIETPPFLVWPLKIANGGTLGGVRVNTDLQVVRADGHVVPGLYAVGDCAGSVSAAQGLGGARIGSAVTLGRAAGQNAAHV